MRRLTRLALAFLTASTLHLTSGCTDGVPDPGSFASASELQRSRMIGAATGVDGAMAYFIVSASRAAGPGPGCPSIEVNGDTIIATGGCTTSDGDRIRGSFRGTNVPGFLGGGNDPSQPVELRFDRYQVIDADPAEGDLAIDGTYTIQPDRSAASDLTASLGGLEVRTVATWRTDAGLSSADAGSYVALTGFGSAEIAGRWSMSTDAPSGALELRGDDVLRADFGATRDRCVPITIDGRAAGALCSPAGDE